MKKHPLIITLLTSLLLITIVSCTSTPAPVPFLTTGQTMTLASNTKGFADEITALVLAKCRINDDYKNFMVFLSKAKPGEVVDLKKGTVVEIMEEPSQLVAEADKPVNGIVRVKLPDDSQWFIWW